MNTVARSDRNGWIYGMLLLFFGALGVHRFYLNKIGMGIAYLLTGGFLGIGVLVDVIVLLSSGVRDGNGAEVVVEKSLKVFVVMLIFLSVMIFILVGTIIGVGARAARWRWREWERGSAESWRRQEFWDSECPKNISITIDEETGRVDIQATVRECEADSEARAAQDRDRDTDTGAGANAGAGADNDMDDTPPERLVE